MNSPPIIGILEDSLDKLGAIQAVLQEVQGISLDDVHVMNNIKDAKRNLAERAFDILILDLNLPTEPDGKPKSGNGLKFLTHVCESVRYVRPRQVIFLSEFDQELSALQLQKTGRAWHAIHYSRSTSTWSEELIAKLEYILSAEKQRAVEDYDYDAVFLTALDSPELAALEQITPNWKATDDLRSRILTCAVPNKATGGTFRFIASAAPQLGCTASAVSTISLLQTFRPRLFIMCGIAAGIKGECNYGDILVAESSWEWGSGKYVQRKNSTAFQHAPTTLRASTEIITKLRDRQYVRKLLAEVASQWPAQQLCSSTKLRIGPVVSGPSVIASSQLTKLIRKQHRKLLGIEMETYGAYYACESSSLIRPHYVSMKAVCDFADATKSDQFQQYAAFVSARFAFQFAQDFLNTLPRRS